MFSFYLGWVVRQHFKAKGPRPVLMCWVVRLSVRRMACDAVGCRFAKYLV